ncbi:MAG: heme exporter protein CcmB [Polyangiaceae bacterium]|nr:heme exporter protein CcmB [Polyangiaceae bacterium]MCW5792636.1 heme exporter protein CcmB [Polyangiaceae bacterium]
MPNGRRPPPSWWGQAWLLLKKDLRVEARTGEVVTTSGFFAVLVVVLASMAFYGGATTRQLVASGALWLSVAFAAILAIGRTWQREREEAALVGLLSSPLHPSALFAGKGLGVLFFLALVEVLVIPLTALFFSLDLWEVGAGVVVVALFATPGIAASGTLFGAMTARTRARDLVLATVLFPLLSPCLIAAVVATRELLDGASISELRDHLTLLLVFDVVFIAGGLGLFRALIYD